MIREFDYTRKLNKRCKLYQCLLHICQNQQDKLLLTLSCHISLIVIKNTFLFKLSKKFCKVICTIILLRLTGSYLFSCYMKNIKVLCSNEHNS